MRLVTTRLLLRPFQSVDVEDCLTYRNDAEFARYLRHIPQPFTRAHAEAFIRQHMTEPFDRNPTFAIEFFGRVIGTINLEIDASARSAMLGYAIGRAYWGRGLTTEAAEAVLAWAFDTLKIEKVWASASPENLASHKVLQKLGMTLERTEPEPTFAISADTWKARTYDF